MTHRWIRTAFFVKIAAFGPSNVSKGCWSVTGVHLESFERPSIKASKAFWHSCFQTLETLLQSLHRCASVMVISSSGKNDNIGLWLGRISVHLLLYLHFKGLVSFSAVIFCSSVVWYYEGSPGHLQYRRIVYFWVWMAPGQFWRAATAVRRGI